MRREQSAPGVLKVKISDPAGMATALETIRGLARPVVTLTGVGQTDLAIAQDGADTITVQLSDAEKTATDDRTMQQSLEIIRRRVDEAGTREPTIQRQGNDRILIEVPGIGSGCRAEKPDRHHRAADLQRGRQPDRRRPCGAGRRQSAAAVLGPEGGLLHRRARPRW